MLVNSNTKSYIEDIEGTGVSFAKQSATRRTIGFLPILVLTIAMVTLFTLNEYGMVLMLMLMYGLFLMLAAVLGVMRLL